MTEPEAICRSALLACGVPQWIVDDLEPGPLMDVWVHFVVMNREPWESVQARVESARESMGDKDGENGS